MSKETSPVTAARPADRQPWETPRVTSSSLKSANGDDNQPPRDDGYVPPGS